jgi:hypothetical protein
MSEEQPDISKKAKLVYVPESEVMTEDENGAN